jgi:argininosuccinate synthase
MKKIVLAYSGGLDTSIAVGWLKERGFEVVGFLGDVGQPINKKKLNKKAKDTGIKKFIIKDLRNEFVKDYIIPAIKANAVYEDKYYLATALSRPLLSKAQVSIAKKEKASYLGHGCTGKGNDQVRFEMGFASLAPDMQVVAPAREWDFASREEQVDYALAHKIPVDVTKKSPYSIDENLWGVSIECGVLEDPKKTLPDKAYLMTKSPEKAPAKSQVVKISFKKGAPVKLNGKKMPAIKIIEKLNKIGGKHAIGRADMIENRSVGIKSREVYEAPAAAILVSAHKELEAMTLDKASLHHKAILEKTYADLIYHGCWFTPLKEAIEAFIDKTQDVVTGDISLKLYKGSITVVSRDSDYSLYKKDLATYSEDDVFDRTAASGFIKLMSLPYKITGKRKK